MLQRLRSLFSRKDVSLLPDTVTNITLEELAQRIWLAPDGPADTLPPHQRMVCTIETPQPTATVAPSETSPAAEHHSPKPAATDHPTETPDTTPRPVGEERNARQAEKPITTARAPYQLRPSTPQNSASRPSAPSTASGPPTEEPRAQTVHHYKREGSPLWEKHVDPHREIFSQQGALPGVDVLLDILYTYGDCPSVVRNAPEQDSEFKELVSAYVLLGQVSLREHTFHVVTIGMELLERHYRDYRTLVPMALVAFLVHDIRKIPQFRGSGVYTSADHPEISAAKPAEIFHGKWMDEAKMAVINHHRRTSEQFPCLACFGKLTAGPVNTNLPRKIRRYDPPDHRKRK